MTGPVSPSHGGAPNAPIPDGEESRIIPPDRELTFISETTDRAGRRFLPEKKDMRKWLSEQVYMWKSEIEPYQIERMKIEATLHRTDGSPFLVDHKYGTPTLRFEIDFHITFPDREEPIDFSMDYYTAEPVSLDPHQMMENKASALHNVETFIDCLLWRAYKHSPESRKLLERRSPIENLGEVADNADFSSFVTNRHCYTLHHQIPRTLGKLRQIHFPGNDAEEARLGERIQQLTDWQARMPNDFHELQGGSRIDSRRVIPKMERYRLPTRDLKMKKSWVERHVDELAENTRRLEANEEITGESPAVRAAQQELGEHLLDNLSYKIEESDQLLHFIDRAGVNPIDFATRQREQLVAEQQEFNDLFERLHRETDTHEGLSSLSRFGSQVEKRKNKVAELEEKIAKLDRSLRVEEEKAAAVAPDPVALTRQWILEESELKDLQEMVTDVGRKYMSQEQWDRYEELRVHVLELEAQLISFNNLRGIRSSFAARRVEYGAQIARYEEQIRVLHQRRDRIGIAAEEFEAFIEGNSRLRKLARSIEARLRHLRGITFHCGEDGWNRLHSLYPDAEARLREQMSHGYFDLIGGDLADAPRRIMEQEELINRRNRERIQQLQR